MRFYTNYLTRLLIGALIFIVKKEVTMIKISNIKKQYSSEVAIGPLEIDIPKAGLTSLIGPNGAGKSTTLLMIGRLLDIDEGQIAVADMDIASSKSKDLAKILT